MRIIRLSRDKDWFAGENWVLKPGFLLRPEVYFTLGVYSNPRQYVISKPRQTLRDYRQHTRSSVTSIST